MAYLKNHLDYLTKHPSGSYAGANVISVGRNKLWGWEGAGSVKSYGDWTNELIDAYNAPGGSAETAQAAFTRYYKAICRENSLKLQALRHSGVGVKTSDLARFDLETGGGRDWVAGQVAAAMKQHSRLRNHRIGQWNPIRDRFPPIASFHLGDRRAAFFDVAEIAGSIFDYNLQKLRREP